MSKTIKRILMLALLGVTLSIPAYAQETELDSEWTLIWSDEFDGDSLDTSKWAYQIGTAAENGGPLYWGNNELQSYQKSNVSVADGLLTITAQKESQKIDNMLYTSARLWTNPLAQENITEDFEGFTTKYGRIEAKMSVPAVTGMWPAFWMLPANSPYGGWAAGGEIDIMEARGRVPDVIGGTIHFGGEWPDNTRSGAEYSLPDGQDITGMHEYAIEWEPGEIRWYIDDHLYFTENNWYAKNSNEPVDYTYPAPFNQDFYLLLNLAIGGNYDSNKKPPTDFSSADMVVDYVRVYQSNQPYNESVEKQIVTAPYPDDMQPLDDYIEDNNLQNVVPTSGPLDKINWNLLSLEGGVASTSVEDNVTKINIANDGNQIYSVQLLEHFPIVEGHIYQISFDAKSDASRSIMTQFGADESRGWAKYSEPFKSELSEDWQSYSYRFQMASDTDINGRLEINLGLDPNSVFIKNISVTEVDSLLDLSAPKTLLPDGNHLYNGQFDTGHQSKVFWDGDFDISENNEALLSGVLTQEKVELRGGESYEIVADLSEDVVVEILGENGDLLASAPTVDGIAHIDLPNTFELEYGSVRFVTEPTVIDNIQMIRTSNNNIDWDQVSMYPLKNGSFIADYAYWTPFTQGARAGFSVADNSAVIDITTLGAESWRVMLEQANLNFTKNLTYKFSFDAWADVPRNIGFTIEDASYIPSINESFAITTEPQRFEYKFMPHTPTLSLKFLLGLMDNAQIGKVYIDNVIIEADGAPVKPPAMLIEDEDNNRIGQDIELRIDSEEGWSLSNVLVNDTLLSEEQFSYSDGLLKINASVFDSDGAYKIVAEAEGYAPSELWQNMLSSDGNLLINGKFTTPTVEPWGFWTGGVGHSDTEIVNNQLKVNVNTHAGIAWNTQIFQTVDVVSGKTYTLSFDAKSNLQGDELTAVDRPIKVELPRIGVPGNAVVFNLSGELESYSTSFVPKADASLKINFLFGNIINNSATTPDIEHVITLDNISLIEVE